MIFLTWAVPTTHTKNLDSITASVRFATKLDAFTLAEISRLRRAYREYRIRDIGVALCVGGAVF